MRHCSRYTLFYTYIKQNRQYFLPSWSLLIEDGGKKPEFISMLDDVLEGNKSLIMEVSGARIGAERWALVAIINKVIRVELI